MRALHFLFSPSGRLRPQDFGIAAAAVYAAGLASQWLTRPDALAHGGLWLFAAVQAALIWIWFALHAKRLHDADRASGPAAAVAVLYAISIVLLVIVAAAFFNVSSATLTDANTTSALGLILLLSVIATLSGPHNHDFGEFLVVVLTVLAFLPIVLALAVTLWAATRPSSTEPSA